MAWSCWCLDASPTAGPIGAARSVSGTVYDIFSRRIPANPASLDLSKHPLDVSCRGCQRGQSSHGIGGHRTSPGSLQ
jgi:hypothetical protein